MIAAPVIGHRGVASLAPENTLASVRMAADLGVRWVEVDAQLCGDGTAIVFHDDTLERCTNGTGAVAAHGYAELAELDAGSWFDPRFEGERIPHLGDLFALCRERGIGINLELKVGRGRDAEALAVAALETLAAYGPPSEDVLVSSFDEAALAACRQRDPRINLGLICQAFPSDLEALKNRLGLVSLHVDWRHLGPEHVAAARTLGLEVYAWTVNDPRRARLLWDWGVSGVITDRPQDFGSNRMR